ncbi:hypothetical protein [Granulicella sp. L60]|uniref:hypothetical protein n=1 Tax=Granulicella sp. L60 TaxID=1641866 RepID=UPI00131C67D2|nr:hypothetical protein [Granulicella sp. L60]
MVNLTVGMLTIRRGAQSDTHFCSGEMAFALEDIGGGMGYYDGFQSMCSDLRRKFIFEHDDLKVARIILESNSEAAFRLDASRI